MDTDGISPNDSIVGSCALSVRLEGGRSISVDLKPVASVSCSIEVLFKRRVVAFSHCVATIRGGDKEEGSEETD